MKELLILYLCTALAPSSATAEVERSEGLKVVGLESDGDI